MRLNHTEVVSADELEGIHEASLTILERIGMDIWDSQARTLLRQAGAEVDEATQHVRFPKELILERIATAPAEFTMHSWNPERNLRHRRHMDGQRNGCQCAAHRRSRRHAPHR